MESELLLNTLVIHPNFYEIISSLNKEKIVFPSQNEISSIDFSAESVSENAKLSLYEDFSSINLNPKNGEIYCRKVKLLGYDESFVRYPALEGVGYFTSHSLVLHDLMDYIPSNLITLYFYTRSNLLLNNSEHFKRCDDTTLGSDEENKTDSFEAAFKQDYATDRYNFLIDRVPENSILFIDGPLIGGQISKYSYELNRDLLKREIIPIFFVKNSNSNLVTFNVTNLKGNFNSDLHWANSILKPGQRTNLFKYKLHEKFSKIFCYLKAFELSPQRIEFHPDTYNKYPDEIHQILDLIYYLILAQGDFKNPQVRTIAVAEKYARATIGLFSGHQMLKSSSLVPTMNENRGFG